MADSFIIYKKKKTLFDKLSCEQAGQLIKAIFQFQENGERPADAMIDFLLEDFVVDFEKAADIREKRKKSGKQGAERRWAKTTQTKNPQPSVPQQSQPDNVLFDVPIFPPTTKNTVKKPNLTEIKEYWNANINGNAIPKISKIQHDRESKVNARFKEYGRDGIMTVISKVANSRFLNSKTFHVTFDWVFSPNNFPKILDGNYDNDKVNNKTSNATSALDVFNQVFNDGNNSTESESTIDIEATIVG